MTSERTNRPRRTLLVVIDSLGGGGAERVMATLVREWTGQGDRVGVALLSPRAPQRYMLDASVPVYPLASGGRYGWLSFITRNVRRMAELREIVGTLKPDVVLGFMPRANILSILAGAGDRLVASERAMPELVSPMTRILMRLLYRKCRMLVCVSRGVSEAFDWLPAKRRRVIRNPVAARAPSRLDGLPSRPFILAAGRLDVEKRFDILITAFAAIATRRPEIDLVICGEGRLRQKLEALICEKKLETRVHLQGWADNLEVYIAGSEFVVLSSESEGLPNVLIEAMLMGKAVVATNTPGAADIITADVDGLIVPVNDADALGRAMERLCLDKELRSRLEAQGPRAAHRYDLVSVVAEWERLFDEIQRNGQRVLASK